MKKVGDVIKIRTDLVEDGEYKMKDSEYADVVAEDMLEYCGQESEITAVDEFGYHLAIDEESWSWTDEMFEDEEN